MRKSKERGLGKKNITECNNNKNKPRQKGDKQAYCCTVQHTASCGATSERLVPNCTAVPGTEELKTSRTASGILPAAEGPPLVIRRRAEMGGFKAVPEKTSYSQGRGTWDQALSCQQLWCIHL